MRLNNTVVTKKNIPKLSSSLDAIYRAKRKVEVVRITSKGDEVEVGDVVSLLHNNAKLNVCIAKIDINNNQYLFVVEAKQNNPQFSILNGLEICMSFNEADPKIFKELP